LVAVAEVENSAWNDEEAVARKFVAYKFVPVAEVEKRAWKEEEAVARKLPV